MKFGIHHSSWLDSSDPAEAFETAKAKARWAEDHGFTWFSVMDHTIQIPRVGPPDEPVLEGWAVLAGLAAVTSRIRLATLATAVGYRNPAHLAKIAATVDLMSRGRLTLGIGAGFYEEEYRQYGWEFPPEPATRIRQMEEAVQLILRMWTEPRTTFNGRYFRVEDAILEPKPVQKPRPPVMIAGAGEQMTLRAVARLADASNFVGGDLAEIRHKLAVLQRHCDAAGRDYDDDREDPRPALAARPRRGRAGGEARAPGRPEPDRRPGLYGVGGHRPDRAIPGRRRRPADPQRSTERPGDPRALRLGNHPAVRLTAQRAGRRPLSPVGRGEGEGRRPRALTRSTLTPALSLEGRGSRWLS